LMYPADLGQLILLLLVTVSLIFSRVCEMPSRGDLLADGSDQRSG